ncbi:MAG: alanine dehydrogenase [Alphaproteobacteria bacterium]
MRIGVPKEIKSNEKRVGLVADSVRELTARGHSVLVETGAGDGIGQADAIYREAGAEIAPDAAAVFEAADMIVKVKEPQPQECAMLHPGQTLFTYLHLAPDPVQAKGLVKSACTAIAYETVTGAKGGLPLLAPMSEVAGRMATQVAAHCLENAHGGAGILMGGVPGVEPAKVVILGGGVAGSNALTIAVGMGADVTVIERDTERLRALDARYGTRIKTVHSNAAAIERHVLAADAVIGTVLLPGAAAPKLITRDLVRGMEPGSVIVDVAVDQGGCAETTRATTHDEPTFVVDGVVHYCVANMPGGVARTSAFALNNATLPHVLAIAEKGVERALREDEHLRAGLNVCRGAITHEAVANDLDLPYVAPGELLPLAAAA